MYSVGKLSDPRPDDKRFRTQREAERHARETSYPERTLGIWHDGALVAIAYDGLVYWP